VTNVQNVWLKVEILRFERFEPLAVLSI